MPSRSYNLLCPISRALDHVGDRWALLILRDLHAGPVRHKDLAAGLTGIPSNLLASRLKELLANKLIQKTINEHGVPLYSLTELGKATGPLLFELSKLGTRFPADENARTPGNLRLAAVTLKEALSRVADDSTFDIELRIEGEPLEIRMSQNGVQVRYRPALEPQAIISVPYEPMIAYGDGRMTKEKFAEQVVVEGDFEVAGQFLQHLEHAMLSMA